MRHLLVALLAFALTLLAVTLVAVTSAQTPPTKPTKKKPEGCEYRWSDGDWVLVDSNCPTGHCEPPTGQGQFEGQTVYRPCTPDDCGCR